MRVTAPRVTWHRLFEMDVIRLHVLGRSATSGAVANSCRMSYLDNYLSSAAPSTREPTRGAHGAAHPGGTGYAGDAEVARAFTAGARSARGHLLVPGHLPRPGGEDDPRLAPRPRARARRTARISDLLVRNPSTAGFISTKLCRRLVSDTPSEAVVARGADAFTSSNGDLAEVLRAIIGTADFWSEAFGPGKIKTPHEFVVSVLRAIGAEVTSARAFVEGSGSSLTSMGMPTYEALDPTGWSDRGTDWLPNPGSHLSRMNFVLSLVSQTTQGVAVDLRTLIGSVDASDAAAVTAAVDQRIFGGTMPPDVASACRSVGASGSLQAGFKVVGLALASPAFQAR